MMNEDKLLTVARYLEGVMEPEEQQGFEALLENDTELQSFVAEYRNVHESLRMKISPLEADRQVEATLLSLNKQYFKGAAKDEAPPRVIALKPYLKWISIVAVFAIGLLVWAPWSASLYEKYGISKEMAVAERSGEGKPELGKAAELYNSGDFAGANEILHQAYPLEPENSMLAYYYGITLMETGKLTEARTLLSKLYAGESVFKYDAAYCIALSYVKEKNKHQALTWLAKIPKGTPHYEKARALTLAL